MNTMLEVGHNVLVHCDQATGEWLDSPVDLSRSTLVAESRSGVTACWKTPDGALYVVCLQRSGNVELCRVAEIPAELTRRYAEP